MAEALSSTAPLPSATGCAQVPYSNLPTSDAACAVALASPSGLPSNTTSIMQECCKDAPVENFASDCARYCLSVDQSISDLTACFMDKGINPAWIFCNSNNTATATGKPSSSGAAAKSTGAGGTKTVASESGSSATGTAATGTNTPGAAAVMMPKFGVSKAGMGMLVLLGVGAYAGTIL
ncbi:hypothetical protein P154DRAFT_521685 [Amniculicola lignicola CBS 123094]|uniref:Uncharacterized protein n=1 Tax=Amniculicola lignicola CBS 123094 TaxID=1392246 RepID=A0A6A5WLK7_9PLEO|nr:hypothetical protein P154DRAFT_521685 [Amniculicola lignicola CBS 123094]